MLGFVLHADLGKFKSLALKGKNRNKVIGQVEGSVFFIEIGQNLKIHLF